MISFEQVHKLYASGHAALKGVSFSVGAGELVFLTGHSGAGKTTLLKLIPGIERPSSGRVLVNEQEVGSMRAREIPYLRRNLGLIFQDQKLLYDRSVLDNVLLPLAISGFPAKDAARRARAALDKVGLLEREKAAPITLSGGEQQRLCIARAVVNRPNILIADEPTANLDTKYADEIIEMFRSFNQVGVTVLIATHDTAMLERLQPRVVTLSHGEVLAP